MAFTRVGLVAEVTPGTVMVCEVRDREVVVCNVGGTLYAIDNVCTHDDGSLDQGELEGCEIECPRHGARFDVRTGEVTAAPALLPVDTFPVRLAGDEIEVDV